MDITLNGHTMTANLTGELDHHTAAYMRSSIDAAFVRQKPRELVLDFSRITFMDSSGVGLVLGRYKRTREKNCLLVLSGLSERDGKMMRMSGMQKMELIEFR